MVTPKTHVILALYILYPIYKCDESIAQEYALRTDCLIGQRLYKWHAGISVLKTNRLCPLCFWEQAISSRVPSKLVYRLRRHTFSCYSRRLLLRAHYLPNAPVFLLYKVEAEYLAALKKANVGKVAVSKDPKAKAIIAGFRM